MTDSDLGSRCAACIRLVRQLRRRFRDRNDHHPNCISHEDKPCDCYASASSEAHVILDNLESYIKTLGNLK